MIKSISAAAGRALAKNAEYTEDKEEILVYMLTRLIANSIFLTLLFAFSTFLEITLTTFVVLVTFLPIRRTFGGWHVQNIYLCLSVSVAVLLAIGYIATLIEFNMIGLGIVYILAYGIALRIGVVDNKNKRLKESRKEKFKKQGLISLTIIVVINVLVLLYGNVFVSNAMVLGTILGFFNLLIAEK
ncbi:MAG: accessory gene regulator B family protein [Clostridia bacterium]|nr:accessory gene regulator B family protein [Clostridia bacterium]